MDAPLWTAKYQPSIEELGQAELRARLSELVGSRLNLLLYGPAGCGKTAAAKALARETHEQPESDLMLINADDFFSLSKKELREDPRFSRFIDASTARSMSKADLMNHALKQLSGNKPASGKFKTILVDNAESMRPDFQHALRRVMERHYEATQFILTTRSRSVLINPIKSRLVPVPVTYPTDDELEGILSRIATEEGVEYTKDGLHFIIGYATSVAEMILAAQTVASYENEITMDAAQEHLTQSDIEVIAQDALDAASEGDLGDARKAVNKALIGQEMDGVRFLEEIVERASLKYGRETYSQLVKDAADVDTRLADARNERVHIMDFLSSLQTTAASAHH